MQNQEISLSIGLSEKNILENNKNEVSVTKSGKKQTLSQVELQKKAVSLVQKQTQKHPDFNATMLSFFLQQKNMVALE